MLTIVTLSDRGGSRDWNWSGCTTLVVMPLFGAIGVVMAWWFVSSLWQHAAARSWVVTPARILEARLVESHNSTKDGDVTTYRVQARYAYTFAERNYESTRVSFYGGGDNFGSFHRKSYEELSRYLPSKSPTQSAKKFRCFVNPANPTEAVLYRSMRAPIAAAQLLFALGFGWIGFGPIIRWMADAARSRRRQA